MMKFASFETIVEMLYKYAIPTPKDQCSKTLQLGVSFAGGYVAGVFCAIVSHPADNLVSFLNNAKGATVRDVREFFAYYFMDTHTPKYIIFILPCSLSLLYLSIAGRAEARVVGSFHPWPSSPYSHDWNPHRCPVGNL